MDYKRIQEHGVILVGKGSGWHHVKKQKDTKKEIWSLNHMCMTAEKHGIKLDRLFIMDHFDDMPSMVEGHISRQSYVDQIKKLGIPFYCPYGYDDIPNSIPYPLDEIMEAFNMPYLNNTICFMIAFAIYHGAKEMHLYGINQVAGKEYYYEKACVEYWLGLAQGLGISTHIHGSKSALLRNRIRFGGNLLYGYNKTATEALEELKKVKQKQK